MNSHILLLSDRSRSGQGAVRQWSLWAGCCQTVDSLGRVLSDSGLSGQGAVRQWSIRQGAVRRWSPWEGGCQIVPAGKMKLEFLENPSSTFAWIFNNIQLIPSSFLGFC